MTAEAKMSNRKPRVEWSGVINLSQYLFQESIRSLFNCIIITHMLNANEEEEETESRSIKCLKELTLSYVIIYKHFLSPSLASQFKR